MEAPAAYAAGVLNQIKEIYSSFRSFSVEDPYDPLIVYFFGREVYRPFTCMPTVQQIVNYVMFEKFKLFISPFDSESWPEELEKILTTDYSRVHVPFYDESTVLEPIRVAVSKCRTKIIITNQFIQSMAKANKLRLVRSRHIMSMRVLRESIFVNYSEFAYDVALGTGTIQVFKLRRYIVEFMRRFSLRFHSRTIGEILDGTGNCTYYVHDDPDAISRLVAQQTRGERKTFEDGYAIGDAVILPRDGFDRNIISSVDGDRIFYYGRL